MGEGWEHQSLLPIPPCSSIMVCGSTGSGKSRFVYRVLQHVEGFFPEDPPVEIMYCYSIWQPLFEEMEANIPNITLHQGLPDQTDIETFSNGKHKLVCLDDLMHKVVNDENMELLFTQGCHHRRMSVIFISQNVFQQEKSARTISINTSFIVLFRNLPDESQIINLGKQLFPHKSKYFFQAYEDCMSEPYSYLMIDNSPKADRKLRLRTRLFPGEDPIVYVIKV